MLSWIAYAALLSLWITLAALAVERALLMLGRPTRGVWAVALVASLLAPVLLARGGDEASASPSVLVVDLSPLLVETRSASAGDAATSAVSLPALDAIAGGAWLAMSGAVLLWLAVSTVALLRRRRSWQAAEVCGERVLLTRDTGPAVIGLLRAAIVLPHAALRWDAEALRLIVAHERAHIRAGDHRLLFGALLFAAAIPWSPAVWWMVRRLRLAVEMDCDARVLRGGADARTYGALLLAVTRRRPGERMPVPAFAESRAFVARRVARMTAPRPRFAAALALAMVLLAGVATSAVALTPRVARPALLWDDEEWPNPRPGTTSGRSVPSLPRLRSDRNRSSEGGARSERESSADVTTSLDQTDPDPAPVGPVSADLRLQDANAQSSEPSPRPRERPRDLLDQALERHPELRARGAPTTVFLLVDRSGAVVMSRTAPMKRVTSEDIFRMFGKKGGTIGNRGLFIGRSVMPIDRDLIVAWGEWEPTTLPQNR